MRKQRWQDWLLLIGGIWLFVAPWVLGTSSDLASSWNAWIVGVAVAAIAWWALARPGDVAAEWIQALLGAWLVVAPWVLGFGTPSAAAWNAWLLGGAVVIFALWAYGEMRRSSGIATRSPADHPAHH